MTNPFYKKGYLIAIYDSEDNLITVCDNVKEFASAYHIKRIDVAYAIIRRINKGERKSFNFKGEKRTIVLIPLDPKEIKSLTTEKG